VLANRILGVISMILAWPVLPLQIVTTFVGGCLVSCTFGLLLIPLSIIWLVFFLWPLLGLSWLWDKAPILRIPLAIVGIPLAALGSVYVALIPSMGEIQSRAVKLVLCDTWPFTLDYYRTLQGIDVPDFDRLARIKEVMWRLRVGEPPDTLTYVAKVINDADGAHIASGILRMGGSLVSESTHVGEVRFAGIGDQVGPGRKVTIQGSSPHDPDRKAFEFPLTEYQVEPDVIRFTVRDPDIQFFPFTSPS
jgi:hypothetical protein